MAKISDIYQWLYGLIRGRPTNYNWIVDKKLAGSGDTHIHGTKVDNVIFQYNIRLHATNEFNVIKVAHL